MKRRRDVPICLVECHKTILEFNLGFSFLIRRSLFFIHPVFKFCLECFYFFYVVRVRVRVERVVEVRESN